MKRVSLDRLRLARDSLGAVPLPKAGGSLMGFFALSRQGVSKDNWTAVSPTHFAELADDFFDVPGAPDPEFPYFDPLGPKAGWRNDNWARGSVNTTFQRDSTPLRRDPAKLEHKGSGENREWRFNDGYEQSLSAYLEGTKIPAVDYAAWVYRAKAFPEEYEPGDLVRDLRGELRLTEPEFGALFVDNSESEDSGSFFTEDDWATDAILDMLPGQHAESSEAASGAEQGGESRPEAPDDGEVIQNIWECLRADEHFDVPEELVHNLLYSLRSDRIAILEGKPGSGKTEFVRSFVHCLRRALSPPAADVHLVQVAVSEELAEFDLIGYRDLAGNYVSSAVMDGLNRGDPDNDLYVLLLDEINLASVDVYGAKLIAGITNRIPVELPGKSSLSWFPESGKWTPHTGIIVIGTMNSYLVDPSRKMLSTPIKRRANLIRMPDPLRELASSHSGDDVPQKFLELCRLLLNQLVVRLRRRGLSLLEGRLIDQLTQPVPEAAAQLLWRLTRRLSVLDEVAMTMGLVQSILRYVQTSQFDLIEVALDIQVDQKVLPLLRGHASVLDEVQDALGAGDWARSTTTIERMRRLAEQNAGRIRPLL